MSKIVVNIAKLFNVGQTYRGRDKDLFGGGFSKGKPHRPHHHYQHPRPHLHDEYDPCDWTY